MQRLSWYTSCFFDDYQDVCQNIKNEDKKIIFSIEKLWKNHDVILTMIRIYVDLLLKNPSQDGIIKIRNSLVRFDSILAASSVSNYAFSLSLSSIIYGAFGLRFSLFNKFSMDTLFTLNVYGRVHFAAQAAERLKIRYPIYYHMLYSKGLEMFYFLIEDHINKAGYYGEIINDNELISVLWKLLT